MNAVDTNVWLYSHDTRDPRKQALAQQLIASTRPLALPWQVGCEFIAASRKLPQSASPNRRLGPHWLPCNYWPTLFFFRSQTFGWKRKPSKVNIPFPFGMVC
jgi:hypothetical protein